MPYVLSRVGAPVSGAVHRPRWPLRSTSPRWLLVVGTPGHARGVHAVALLDAGDLILPVSRERRHWRGNGPIGWAAVPGT